MDTIYFGFAQAFDTVPHKRLLAKVHSYGNTGNILLWIKSFLNGREQRVVVNWQKSSWTDVISGGIHSWPDSVYYIHQWHSTEC